MIERIIFLFLAIIIIFLFCLLININDYNIELVPKHIRDKINIPTGEYIKFINNNWLTLGRKLFSIPNLYNDNKVLHEEYINLMKYSYFYYHGIDTKISDEVYKSIKYRVLYDVTKWARENYYNGTPKISDCLYDNMKQNMFIKTMINSDSYIPRISNPYNFDSNFDFKSIILNYELWKECSSIYNIDNLKKEDHKLHDRYLNIRMISFLYHTNNELPIEYKGHDGYIKYKEDKYNIINEVVKWAKNNYYSGKPSITDVQYDFLKINAVIRNGLNSRSININD